MPWSCCFVGASDLSEHYLRDCMPLHEGEGQFKFNLQLFATL